jgi:hypothetical protein
MCLLCRFPCVPGQPFDCRCHNCMAYMRSGGSQFSCNFYIPDSVRPGDDLPKQGTKRTMPQVSSSLSDLTVSDSSSSDSENQPILQRAKRCKLTPARRPVQPASWPSNKKSKKPNYPPTSRQASLSSQSSNAGSLWAKINQMGLPN